MKLFSIDRIYSIESAFIEQIVSPTDLLRLFNLLATATSFVKVLATLLLPLSESEYTVKNPKSFIEKVKAEKVPSNYKIVSIDVKSLLTYV